MDFTKEQNKTDEGGVRGRDARGVEEESKGKELVIAISASNSSDESDEEMSVRRLRSHAKKAEPAPKMTLKFTSGELKKKRALRESSGEEAGPAMANKLSTAARGRIRGTAGKHAFLKAAKEGLAKGLESDSGDSDPTYRSSYRPPSSVPTRTLPRREQQGAAGEELRKLRADNARLAKELELVRAELRAFKEAYSESQKRANATATSGEAPQAQPGLEEVLRSAMEEMRRELLQSVGGMVNARLQGLESRLPPEPVVRPPLEADKRQPPPPRPEAQSGLVAGAMRGVPEPAEAPKAKPRPARPGPKKGPKNRPTGPPPPPPPSQVLRGRVGGAQLHEVAAGQEDNAPQASGSIVQWSKVVGRKAKRK
ncbi:PREDICTED: translation initiation factor IF-2-like, partial [Papilio xuthus]|uniref:Translation initiation factor IF-2-like n=1 Tax=Papilio xuthus TaxID=66420 RepID=A0AAJ6YYJ8_PAPXU